MENVRFRVTGAVTMVMVFGLFFGLLLSGCSEEVISNNYYTNEVSTYIKADFRDSGGKLVQNRHSVEVYSMQGVKIAEEEMTFGDSALVYVPLGGIVIKSKGLLNFNVYEFTDTLTDVYSWTDARYEEAYKIGKNPVKVSR